MVGRPRRQRRRRTAAVAGVTASAVSRHSNANAPQEPAPEEAPAQQAPAAAEPTDAEKLEELARLKEQGILTEEEFTAKKAQLLGL